MDLNSRWLSAFFALALPMVSGATPFNIYNGSTQGSSVVRVNFNDGSTVRFNGGSTGIGTLSTGIDNITDCSVVSTGLLECDYTGPLGLAEIAELDLAAYAHGIRYDDDASLPGGYEWHKLLTSDGQEWNVALDPDDVVSFIATVLGDETETTHTPCRTLYDGEGTFVTCGGASLDCDCVMTTIPCPCDRNQRIQTFVDGL